MTTAINNRKIVLVVGAGDTTGGAIAKRFAQEGFVACVTRRSADKLQLLLDAITASGGEAHGFACDARKEEDVFALIEQIETEIGPIEAFVFNIGANVPCSILEETARKYFKIWEMACFSGFLNAREVAKRMVTRQRGTILFTGATVPALTADEDVKAALKENTENAVQRGVFGAPSMFIGNQLFFGQDRLDFVLEALRAQ